jgi:hypothetical protein
VADPVAGAPENPVSPAPLVPSAEDLFSAVDGHDLAVFDRHWTVEVFSVAEINGARFIQLALRGLSDHMLTLRVVPPADAHDVVSRLLAWLKHPVPTGTVVDAS